MDGAVWQRNGWCTTVFSVGGLDRRNRMTWLKEKKKNRLMRFFYLGIKDKR
jgi:hypothetical protein